MTEDELHAYVDGELPADRREAVAAWLAAHPAEAATVAAWRAQAEAIRARYGGIAERAGAGAAEARPDPARRPQPLLEDDSRRRPPLIAFVVGGARRLVRARRDGRRRPAANGTITADALEAYELYVVEVRHPVEVPGSERAHMTKWLSKRLGYQQRIPDLSAIGLKLVGGRLLPGPSGAAAFYMYEGPSGERFTLYCAKVAGPQTGLRFKGGKQSAAFYWVDDKVGYVVAGPDQRDRLERITKLIYEQIDQTQKKS